MKIRIYIKSYSKKTINKAIETLINLIESQKNENIKFYSVALPTRIKKFCVLRSPHIHKNSRQQFEIKIYKRFLDISFNKMEQIFPLFTFEDVYSSFLGTVCSFSIINN